MSVVAHRFRPHLPFYWLSHPCDHPGCDREGCYGFGVKLLARKGGTWFCAAHKADGTALPQRIPEDDGSLRQSVDVSLVGSQGALFPG